MCGFVGYISSRKYNNDLIITSLNHRGPDSKGFFNENSGEKLINFFHNRLSIVDLSDRGNQPMTDENGEIVLIFNGEIYNYKELKEKYLSDFTFCSKTDTEVILNLYKVLGIAFVNKLKGDFSFAVYDKKLAESFFSAR
jgi:asparagine synthase (glutamine-hydrolysing)